MESLAATYPVYASHLLNPAAPNYEELKLWCEGIEGIRHPRLEYTAKPGAVTCPVCKQSLVSRMEYQRLADGKF